MEHRIEQLQLRVEAAEVRARAAERQAKMMTCLWIGSLLLAVILLCLPPAFTQGAVSLRRGTTIQAPLRVVDGSGALLLTVDSQANPGRVDTNRTGPFVYLFDPSGRRRVGLFAGYDGGNLALYSRTGDDVNPPVTLSAGRANSNLHLGGPEGSCTVGLGAGLQYGALSLYNQRIKRVAHLEVMDESGKLILSDREGQRLHTVP